MWLLSVVVGFLFLLKQADAKVVGAVVMPHGQLCLQMIIILYNNNI